MGPMPTPPRPPTGMADVAFDAGFGWQRTARGKNMQQLVLLRPDPGRVLARFHLDRPLAARDDAWVYRQTARLLAHRLVREAFNLPPPVDAPAALPAHEALRASPHPDIPQQVRRHGCG